MTKKNILLQKARAELEIQPYFIFMQICIIARLISSAKNILPGRSRKAGKKH